MDRYSFFIVNSFIGGYSVSAVSKLDNSLPVRSEQYLAIGGDISSNDQDSLSGDIMGVEPTEVENSENVETDPEEISDENGVTETETPFSFEGNPLEVLVPRLTRDNSGWYKDRKWGFQNVYYISGGFSSWNLNPLNAADNVNNMMFAIRDVVQTLQTQVNSISSENARAHRRIDSLSNITTTLTSENARAHRRIDSLSNITTTLTSENARAHRRIDSLGNITTALSGSINTVKDNADRANRRIDSLGDTVSALSGAINTVKDNADRANRRIDSLGDTVSALSGAVNTVKDNADRANRRIDSLGDTVSALSGAVNTVKDNADRANRRIDSLGDTVSALSGAVNTVKDNADRANRRIDSLGNTVSALSGAINTVKDNTDKRFLGLEKKIEGFNWSDVGIITALGLVKDSIDYNFKNMFAVKNLTGIDAHEGIFTRMLKSQFISVKNDINSIFNVPNGTYWSGLSKILRDELGRFAKYLDTYFDINNKESALYKLRYSIVSGFMDLEEVVKLIRGDTLALRESLNTVNTNLSAVNTWLKNIFDKPVGSVIASPFDYDRLAKIIADNMPEMGGGESGWLKQIIKTVGGVIETAIKTLGDVLGKGIDGLVKIAQGILNFLDGLLDFIKDLLIPENLDFMTKEFDGTSKTFKTKFNFIFDGINGFKGLFSGNKNKFTDYHWQLSAFDVAEEVVIPMSLINDYAPVVKPIITGFLILAFIINMYKWFYSRGEVVD